MARLPCWLAASALAVLAHVAGAVGASAQDALVMVETKGCAWCAKWHRELGAIYPKTDEGRRLPLRVVRLESLPADLGHLSDLRYSPTFVVLRCGQEAGRIIGYNGEDMFWGQLDEIAGKLKAAC